MPGPVATGFCTEVLIVTPAQKARAATLPFVVWITVGAIGQVIAAAFFVAAMTHRSFVVAVVFSKTEVLQIGIYSIVFLAESLSPASIAAIVLSTAGVVLLAGRTAAEQRLGTAAWLSRGALLGLGSGAMLAVAADFALHLMFPAIHLMLATIGPSDQLIR